MKAALNPRQFIVDAGLLRDNPDIPLKISAIFHFSFHHSVGIKSSQVTMTRFSIVPNLLDPRLYKAYSGTIGQLWSMLFTSPRRMSFPRPYLPYLYPCKCIDSLHPLTF
jgi:hypothetical protein